MAREREREMPVASRGGKKKVSRIVNGMWGIIVSNRKNSSFRKIAKERLIMYFSSFLNSIIEIDR